MNSSDALAVEAGLDPARLPAHVAIIMDGNGRWAKKRMFNRVKGHEQGADTVRMAVRVSRELGIDVLTLYAFSTENWQRPETEVSALMSLLKRFLKSEKKDMLKHNIRLNTIGEVERLPNSVNAMLKETMQATENNTGMVLNLALSYGARSEIVRMVQQLSETVAEGKLRPEAIDEEMVSAHLYTRNIPDPDLLIRTSGEMRISNFLLWQIAYAEIYITDTLWPDFTKAEYLQILKDYQGRDRRFGKVKNP
ncbi:MAG: isoprenyl transferase [Desulfobulbaceae bacterium]